MVVADACSILIGYASSDAVSSSSEHATVVLEGFDSSFSFSMFVYVCLERFVTWHNIWLRFSLSTPQGQCNKRRRPVMTETAYDCQPRASCRHNHNTKTHRFFLLCGYRLCRAGRTGRRAAPPTLRLSSLSPTSNLLTLVSPAILHNRAGKVWNPRLVTSSSTCVATVQKARKRKAISHVNTYRKAWRRRSVATRPY